LLALILNSGLFSFRVKLEYLSRIFALVPCCLTVIPTCFKKSSKGRCHSRAGLKKKNIIHVVQ